MIKVSKTYARTLYNAGKEIMIIPNKMRTDSFMASWITKPEGGDPTMDFEKLCNAISYYNCSPETGMGLAYYIKEM